MNSRKRRRIDSQSPQRTPPLAPPAGQAENPSPSHVPPASTSLSASNAAPSKARTINPLHNTESAKKRRLERIELGLLERKRVQEDRLARIEQGLRERREEEREALLKEKEEATRALAQIEKELQDTRAQAAAAQTSQPPSFHPRNQMSSDGDLFFTTSPTIDRPRGLMLFQAPTANPHTPSASSHIDPEELRAVEQAERELANRTADQMARNTANGQGLVSAPPRLMELPRQGQPPFTFSSTPLPNMPQRTSLTTAVIADSFPAAPPKRTSVYTVPPVIDSFYESITWHSKDNPQPTNSGAPALTAIPVEGYFPDAFGDSHQWMSYGIPRPQWEVWLTLMKRKVLMHIYGMTAHPREKRHTEALCVIPKLLNSLFKTDTIKMAAPEIALDDPARPCSFLLWDFSEKVEQTLLNFRVFSMEKFQIIRYPLQPTLPNFICSIKGFSYSFTRDENDVRELIISTLGAPGKTEKFFPITKDIEGLSLLPPYEAAKRLLGAISIKIMDEKEPGGAERPIANIYAPPPTSIPNVWRHWKQIFVDATFSNGFSEVGKACENRYCSGCHSYDHYRGFCPFPDIPNWQGPGRDEKNTNATNDNHNGGNGGNGGKRGRGGYRGKRGQRGRGRGQ